MTEICKILFSSLIVRFLNPTLFVSHVAFISCHDSNENNFKIDLKLSAHTGRFIQLIYMKSN